LKDGNARLRTLGEEFDLTRLRTGGGFRLRSGLQRSSYRTAIYICPYGILQSPSQALRHAATSSAKDAVENTSKTLLVLAAAWTRSRRARLHGQMVTAEPSRKKTRRRRAHRARSRTAPPARHVVSRRNFPSIRTDFPLLATAGTRVRRDGLGRTSSGEGCVIL
jgi:hypothetical protein